MGVIFDEHLSWNEHVKAIVFKAGRRVGLLGRVCRYITTHSANAIFLSTIRPTLEYCAGVWGCCGDVNGGTLETLQKCVGRIVIKTPSSDTATKALKWSSLRSRRDEHILKLVTKCIHGRCPQYFKNYLVFNLRTFVLVQRARAISCMYLPEKQKWPRDPFIMNYGF